MSMIVIENVGHGCFVVKTDNSILVFDYKEDCNKNMKEVLKFHDDRYVIFFESHWHDGTYNSSVYEIAQDLRPLYVLSNDIDSKEVPDKGINVAWMSPGDVLEHEYGTKKIEAFATTEKGVCFAITMRDGNVVFYGGELGCVSKKVEEDRRELQKEENKLETVINRVTEKYPEILVALMPVDATMGEDYAKGAQLLLTKAKVAKFFPINLVGEPPKACNFKSYIPQGVTTECHCIDKPRSAYGFFLPDDR